MGSYWSKWVGVEGKKKKRHSSGEGRQNDMRSTDGEGGRGRMG